jgi:hypothetical protein
MGDEMNDALSRLVAAHPSLFLGFDLGDSHLPPGWYVIVDRLCSELEQILGDDAAAFRVHQIKSKFASLRFYCALTAQEPEGEPPPSKVISHAGGYTITAQSNHPKKRAIDEAIARAGLEAEHTCETCGITGQQLVDGGWVYVACRSHRRPGSITTATYLARKRRRKSKGA